MTGDDPFAHFAAAQHPVIDRVLAELRAGKKRTHWMWFVFPQIAGLGKSDMARKFALGGLEAARAYLESPVVGARLREATEAVFGHAASGLSATALFGTPDDMKFHSSMTLFHLAAPDEKLFKDALDAYFEGRMDPGTMERV